MQLPSSPTDHTLQTTSLPKDHTLSPNTPTSHHHPPSKQSHFYGDQWRAVKGRSIQDISSWILSGSLLPPLLPLLSITMSTSRAWLREDSHREGTSPANSEPPSWHLMMSPLHNFRGCGGRGGKERGATCHHSWPSTSVKSGVQVSTSQGSCYDWS